MKSSVQESKSKSKVRKPIYKRGLFWLVVVAIAATAYSSRIEVEEEQPVLTVTSIVESTVAVEAPSTTTLDIAAGVLMEHFIEDVFEEKYHMTNRSTFQPTYSEDGLAGEVVTKYETTGWTLKMYTYWNVGLDGKTEMVVTMVELYTNDTVYDLDLAEVPTRCKAIVW